MGPEARILAFYLPQFHPIPENDAWWGPGFTEWTNVRRARPWFEGHDQPREPSLLGYYDLRDPAVHFAQAELARRYGIGGFCYYAYWFGGRRLLEQPLAIVRSHADLGLPYAICWANEPWSRRWDGSEDQVLMAQRHAPDTDAQFIDDHAEHLADSRYVRIDGRPLLLIYRAALLSDPRRTTDSLRDRADRLGLGNLYLAMVQSFGQTDPRPVGFDAAVEFPPHGYERTGWLGPSVSRPRPFEGFDGDIRDYEAVADAAMSRDTTPYPWFRGVMPDWDNTPRRGAAAVVYARSSPDRFRVWLESALRFTYLFRPVPERLLFVNAWNEWGEGAYLEPDVSHGRRYLEAISNALASSQPIAVDTARQMERGPQGARELEAARAAWRASALDGGLLRPPLTRFARGVGLIARSAKRRVVGPRGLMRHDE